METRQKSDVHIEIKRITKEREEFVRENGGQKIEAIEQEIEKLKNSISGMSRTESKNVWAVI